jgi:Outer membrane lipoprotein carrier protein LolA-like
MTFGNRLGSVIAGCGFVLVGVAHNASGSAWTVETLIGLIKVQGESSVAFEEATYSSLLTEPIISRGVLRFVPPDKLEKIVTAPSHERYVVEGDRVTFESERRGIKRTVSLDDYPALRSFVEAFRSSLAGDVVQLRNIYEVTMEGTRGRWTLLLRPHESSGKSVVDYILLSGAEGRIATIAIRSPDGDRAVMTLLPGAPR